MSLHAFSLTYHYCRIIELMPVRLALTRNVVLAGVGEVHDGLWAGLHQRNPDCAAGSLVVDRILACLEAACAGMESELLHLFQPT